MSACVLYEGSTRLKQVILVWFPGFQEVKIYTCESGSLLAKQYHAPKISRYFCSVCFLILVTIILSVSLSGHLHAWKVSLCYWPDCMVISPRVSTDELHWGLRVFASVSFCRCSQSWNSGMLSSSELIQRIFLMNLESCCYEVFSVLKNQKLQSKPPHQLLHCWLCVKSRKKKYHIFHNS